MCSVAQSCLTVCDPVDCSSPGSSVHGIFQARIPEWVAIFYSRGCSQPRDGICLSCISGGFFTTSATCPWSSQIQRDRTGVPWVIGKEKWRVF